MKNSYKILLSEDDKFISRAYMDGLTRAGYSVVTAYDGAEALKLFASEKPDLMLLDLIMPVKNGFEVLEEIHDDKKSPKIPIIVLSNLGQDSDIRKAKELDATDYLVKSNVTMKEVIEKVKSYLKK
jgi:DNA-binding response OmpR family regulator